MYSGHESKKHVTLPKTKYILVSIKISGVSDTHMPRFLHRSWGFELRFSGLQSKQPYPLNHFFQPQLYLTWCLSLNLELTHFGSAGWSAGQWVPGSHLSHCSQQWGWRHTLVCLHFESVLEIQIQVLVPMQQVLYPQSHHSLQPSEQHFKVQILSHSMPVTETHFLSGVNVTDGFLTTTGSRKELKKI